MSQELQALFASLLFTLFLW